MIKYKVEGISGSVQCDRIRFGLGYEKGSRKPCLLIQMAKGKKKTHVAIPTDELGPILAPLFDTLRKLHEIEESQSEPKQ